MSMKKERKTHLSWRLKIASMLLAFVIFVSVVNYVRIISIIASENVKTDRREDVQTVVTEYSDLWTGDISVKAGIPVKWYVNVPEGSTLLGCKATIKIPGLGWGTDTHNKDEGHLKLVEGNNLVYEFTPIEEGDILFTCWMGSGCHHNYIHVVEEDTNTYESVGIVTEDSEKNTDDQKNSLETTESESNGKKETNNNAKTESDVTGSTKNNVEKQADNDIKISKNAIDTSTVVDEINIDSQSDTVAAGSDHKSAPQTGDSGSEWIVVMLIASFMTVINFSYHQYSRE
ncbi:MAG: hypothetical protein II919_03175 [Lachnospiraceae bacterium]|nr:hypothetical protein [Lachnospiraceae bacterium]